MSEGSKVGGFSPDANSAVRRSVRAAVDIAVQVFASKMTCCGRGHELGVVGMALHVPLELAIGDSIRNKFHPPGARLRFGVFAVVRDRNGFRYGVELQNLGPTEKAELERIVPQLCGSSIAS